MVAGKVVGSIVSTRKNDKLIGLCYKNRPILAINIYTGAVSVVFFIKRKLLLYLAFGDENYNMMI